MKDLSDSNDIQPVRNIVTELAGTRLMEFGVILGGGSDRDLLKIQMYSLRAIVE